MKQGIIIPSHKRFRQWLNNLLPTIDTPYTVVIHTNTDDNNEYEVGAVKKGLELGLDEFFVLHDTTEVKDNNLFKLLFEDYKGRSVWMNSRGQMFLNKYRKEVLDKTEIPVVTDKRSAVKSEDTLQQRYREHEKPVVLDEGFVDGPAREYKFGRENMVIENKWLKKYKGTWSPTMIKD